MVKNKIIKNNIAIDLERVLVKPHITEKATINTDKNVYVFNVATDANKFRIREAIKNLYKVEPIKINITQIVSKQIVYRGKKGVKSGGKKAYVYLKEGDKIVV
ncbi:MAG: 50S ribosomal protein L23 [Patescibacteria group bacterium]